MAVILKTPAILPAVSHGILKIIHLSWDWQPTIQQLSCPRSSTSHMLSGSLLMLHRPVWPLVGSTNKSLRFHYRFHLCSSCNNLQLTMILSNFFFFSDKKIKVSQVKMFNLSNVRTVACVLLTWNLCFMGTRYCLF